MSLALLSSSSHRAAPPSCQKRSAAASLSFSLAPRLLPCSESWEKLLEFSPVLRLFLIHFSDLGFFDEFFGELPSSYHLGPLATSLARLLFRIPALICCEAYKFHERVQLDSICSNELGDPDAISRVVGRQEISSLDGWARSENLQMLNLMAIPLQAYLGEMKKEKGIESVCLFVNG